MSPISSPGKNRAKRQSKAPPSRRRATADRGLATSDPLRTCVGCRTVRPKSELIRLAVPAAWVTLDPTGRSPGRGAYLCQETGITCLRRSRRHRSLARSLRVGDDVIDEPTLAAALRELVTEEST